MALADIYLSLEEEKIISKISAKTFSYSFNNYVHKVFISITLFTSLTFKIMKTNFILQIFA